MYALQTIASKRSMGSTKCRQQQGGRMCMPCGEEHRKVPPLAGENRMHGLMRDWGTAKRKGRKQIGQFLRKLEPALYSTCASLIVQRRSLCWNYPGRFKGSFHPHTCCRNFSARQLPHHFSILFIADSFACQQKFAGITARHARFRFQHLEWGDLHQQTTWLIFSCGSAWKIVRECMLSCASFYVSSL